MKPIQYIAVIAIFIQSTFALSQVFISDWEMLIRKSESLYEEGQYQRAIDAAKKAVEVSEKQLGKNHPDVAYCLNSLAELYRAKQQYKEAEPIYKRSIAIYEKTSGRNHPHTAIAINNLAILYLDQGLLMQAEPLVKRSLAIRERAFGHSHPELVPQLNSLAELYRQQGRYKKAEPLHKRVLQIIEKDMASGGSQYDEVFKAGTLNNLALNYHLQGLNKEAESLYLLSLLTYEKVFGPDHIELVKPLLNLSTLYRSTNQLKEAEEIGRRVEKIKNMQN